MSASDDTDGDVTDRIEVIGGVDSASAGQYVLTYRVADTNGNEALGSRVVTVVAPELASTRIVAPNIEWSQDDPRTLTAEVAPTTATGTVQFHLDDEVICEVAVGADGVAACTLDEAWAELPAGAYPVLAVYSGDEAHEAAQRVFLATVLGDPGLTESAVESDDLSIVYGKSVNIPVSVWGDRPTGTVTLSDGTGVLASTELGRTGGVVRLPSRSLDPGSHRLTLLYAGDFANLPSSTEVVVQVAKAPPKVVVKLKRTKQRLGKVIVVAVVKVKGAGIGATPTGKVRIKTGKKARTVSLESGRATARFGRHGAKARPRVVVNYRGDRLFAPVKVRQRLGKRN
ncbi:Ig-like domain repeat protein [Nocardioides alcanivorans]|uniref:Ig-like domain repeat protein n=1 Tax=Nocardioides alcanivorans TaxID=2897352 RepID=UPI001F1E66CF|nr:Ig-like domain repeat protein [Nocardioides alcanivorans]